MIITENTGYEHFLKGFACEAIASVKTIVKEGDLHIEQDAKNEPLIKLPDVKVGNIQ